jgi:hypothetical protein
MIDGPPSKIENYLEDIILAYRGEKERGHS